ncbi:MAG: DUF4367 domain-containing protein [Hominisplanchenecus sp.]|uniref:DUF4367 domain-containing protein n=1 Tax=Hominisplanchenecus sp. TaxID=3038130 RepID=UPI003995F16E
MKKNEGKIRNIHSHQDRENLKKAEFDSKLYSTMRSNFAKEGKKIAGELENDEKLDYVGDAPDLLNKIVGQLREEGKWDDNAYRQECKKELYDLLPQEDQIALRRGRKLAKIEEKWKRNRKKIMQRAAIIVLVGGVFVAGLGADASREQIMNIFGKVGSEGQKVFLEKTDGEISDANEERDRKQINEELGINVPKLIYKPEGMVYESYELDDKIQSATMNYLTMDEKYYYIYMSKKAADSREVIEIDGKVINQHLLSVEYLEKGVKVEQIGEKSGKSLYKADFYYDDVYYLLIGELEKEEFDEIIKKMIF